MNIKHKKLSLAVAAVTASLGSMAVSAATFDRPFAETQCYNNYASQTLASQEGKVLPRPRIHDDMPGYYYQTAEYVGGESMLSIDGTIGAGLSGDESRYIRIDLDGATFGADLMEDYDIHIDNAKNIVIHLGGAEGEDYVIITFEPDGIIDAEDTFKIDLDTSYNAGLIMDEGSTRVDVRYRLFSTQYDADHPDTAWGPADKSQCLADTDNDGLDFQVMKDVHDPVASVRCKGGFRGFTIGEMREPREGPGFHGSTARPYSCFIYRGRQNFGGFEIVTSHLDANDGMRSLPADYMYVEQSTVELSDELGWVDTNNAYAINKGDGYGNEVFPFCGYDKPREQVVDALYKSPAMYVPWYFPEGQIPHNNKAHLYVSDLYPYTDKFEGRDENDQVGEGKWNVCLDDWPGDYRTYDQSTWDVTYSYPTIPLKDALMVELDTGERVMYQTEQGSRWSTVYSKKLDINGIDRNGMVLRFPILLSGAQANQKIALTNRGHEDAEYKLYATSEDGESADMDQAQNQGVIKAGTTEYIEVKDMVKFSTNKGGGIIVIAGLPEYIDAAEMLVSQGIKAVENVQADEGYNGGFHMIIQSEDD